MTGLLRPVSPRTGGILTPFLLSLTPSHVLVGAMRQPCTARYVNYLYNGRELTLSFSFQKESLHQIYWYFNLKGPLMGGEIMPICAYMLVYCTLERKLILLIASPDPGNCPDHNIRYLPKVYTRTSLGLISSVARTWYEKVRWV